VLCGLALHGDCSSHGMTPYLIPQWPFARRIRPLEGVLFEDSQLYLHPDSSRLRGSRGRPGAPQPSVLKVRVFSNSLKEVAGKELNFEQRWAISSFLEGAGGGCPFTIYGPPGTGKTVTLVECALQVVLPPSLLLHPAQLWPSRLPY
jgi:hypothetical protein